MKRTQRRPKKAKRMESTSDSAIVANKRTISKKECYEYAQAFNLDYLKVVCMMAFDLSYDQVTQEHIYQLPQDAVMAHYVREINKGLSMCSMSDATIETVKSASRAFLKSD